MLGKKMHRSGPGYSYLPFRRALCAGRLQPSPVIRQSQGPRCSWCSGSSETHANGTRLCRFAIMAPQLLFDEALPSGLVESTKALLLLPVLLDLLLRLDSEASTMSWASVEAGSWTLVRICRSTCGRGDPQGHSGKSWKELRGFPFLLPEPCYTEPHRATAQTPLRLRHHHHHHRDR